MSLGGVRRDRGGGTELALVVVLADLATYVALLHQGSAGVGLIKEPARDGLHRADQHGAALPDVEQITAGRANLWTTFIGLLGAATLGVGIATLATDGWGVLAALMIGLGLMWVLSATHHLLQSAPALPARREPAPPRRQTVSTAPPRCWSPTPAATASPRGSPTGSPRRSGHPGGR